MTINHYLKSLDELHELESKAWRHTCVMDLCLIRKAIRLINGWLIIVGADETIDLEVMFLLKETYKGFNQGEKEYLQKYYGLF